MSKIEVSEKLLNQLYNRENKELFLEEYLQDDATRETYVVYLIQISGYEDLLQKDLSQFNEKEIIDFFANQFTSSPTSLRALFSILKQYLNYMVERGLNGTVGVNPFATLSFKKDILPMLNSKGLEKKYISEEELWGLVDKARNYQDVLPAVLSFYGVKGSKNSEIVNLKRDNVDTVTNKVVLTIKIDEETGELFTREVKLDQKIIKLITDTYLENEYKKAGENHLMNDSYELADSEYIIKPVIQKRSNGVIYDKPTSQLVCSRTKRSLKEAGYESISINDVYNSGKLERLKKIEQEKGKLEIEDYKKIQEEFNDDPKNYSNLRELYLQLAISKAD